MVDYTGFALSGMQDQERWRQLMQHLSRSGFAINPAESYGKSEPRYIAGTTIPSLHGSGEAADFNARTNPEGQYNVAQPLAWDMYGESARKPTTYLDPNVAADAERRLGFKNLRNRGGPRGPDPMHWQIDPTNPAQFTPPTAAPMGAFTLPPNPNPVNPLDLAPEGPQQYGPPNPFPYGQPEPAQVPATDTTPATTAPTVERRGPGGGIAPAMANPVGGFANMFGEGPVTNWADKAFSPRNLGLWEGLRLLAGGKLDNSVLAQAGQHQDEMALRMLQMQQTEAYRQEEQRQARERLGYEGQRVGFEQQRVGQEGQRLDISKAAEQRAAEVAQRDRQQYEADQKIWNDAFPGGVPNPNHPLFGGPGKLTPAEMMTIYGMGPTKGLDYLRQQQMTGFKNREELEQIQRIRDYVQQRNRQPPAATAAPAFGGGPPALPPELQPPATAAAPSASAPRWDYSTPTIQSAPANVAPLGASAPRAAAPAPAAAAPQVAAAPPAAAPQPRPGIPEPRITYGGRNMSLDEARDEAEAWRTAKRPNEVLEKAIAQAEKESGVPEAIKTDAIKTAAAYEDISASLDRYNKIIQKYPSGLGFIGTSADRDVAMGLRNNIILQVKNLHSLGQLSAADLKLAMSIPDPGIRIMPAPFAEADTDAGLNFPGFGLAGRTQASVDALKESILTTRNIKAKYAGIPEIAAPKGETKAEEKAAPKYGPTLTIPGTTKKGRRNLETGKIEEVD